MGVKGLASYVNANCKLDNYKTFSPISASDPSIPFVVDAWSFLFTLLPTLDPPRGGNYRAFADSIKSHVDCWRRHGLKPIFVVDGCITQIKMPTLKSRLENNVRLITAFSRASDSLRATKSFQSECRISPPLTSAALVDAIKASDSEFVIVEGEADSTVARIAIEQKGFMCSQDSDYYIFAAQPGSRGYIPIDSIVYNYHSLMSFANPETDDGWTPVAKVKKVEPEYTLEDCTSITVQVFGDSTLSSHLGLKDPSWLPLFAALVGNDYYVCPFPIKNLPFDNRNRSNYNRAWQRIKQVAAAVAPLSKPKSAEEAHTMIEKACENLIMIALNPGEQQEMVVRIVESIGEYSTVPDSSLVRPTQKLHPSPEDSPEIASLRRRYLHAFQQGQIQGKIPEILQYSTFFGKVFYEDVDARSCVERCRDIRLYLYALLDSTLGITMVENTVSQSGTATEENVEEEPSEEVIDDTEVEEAATAEPVEEPVPVLETPTAVTVDEYVRIGASLNKVHVTISPIATLSPSIDPSIPLPSQSMKDRIAYYLQAMRSECLAQHKDLRQYFPICATLRYLALIAVAKDSWNQPQLRRLALSMVIVLHRTGPIDLPSTSKDVPISRRAIQRTAELLAALDAQDLLSQTLFLTSIFPAAHTMYEGSVFHRLLAFDAKAGWLEPDELDLLAKLEGITNEGLPTVDDEGAKRKMAKKKKAATKAAPPPTNRQNSFNLLANAG